MATPQMIVPTLQIINGPFAGRLYTLERELIVIGRNPDCDVVLLPKSVSRKHAAIVRKRGGFLIEDLKSTRGTFVDSQRLTQPARLEDGQTIQIGEVLLSFSSRLVQIQDGDDEQSTVFASIDLLTQSDKVPAVKPEAKLLALQRISEQLGGTLVLQELLGRIFQTLFEIFPRAERGFVLVREPGSANLVPEAIHSRTGPAGELTISTTILNRVLNDGQAILLKDSAKEFPESQSVTEGRIRSLMCVPLMDQERTPVGIMQIDTRDGRGHFSEEDLDLLAAVANQISVAVRNARLHKALVRQRELEQELQFARQVMQALLPERPTSVPGYEFWTYYEPARHVGGDYYGFFPLSSTVTAPSSSRAGAGAGAGAGAVAGAARWAIAVGDVVGKGMPAALLTARLSAEVRLFLQGTTDPARVVSLLNHQFDDGGVLDLYITFLLVVLDVQRHRVQVVNAGHPCPWARRRDGRIEELGKSASGLPLSIMPGCPYEMAETALEPGETIVLYTDGVTDAMNAADERFGEDRARQALNGAAPGAAAAGEAIVKAMQRFVGDRAQFDDITLVCVARL